MNVYIFHNDCFTVSFECRAEDEPRAREQLRAATLAAHQSGLRFIDMEWTLEVLIKPNDEVLFPND